MSRQLQVVLACFLLCLVTATVLVFQPRDLDKVVRADVFRGEPTVDLTSLKTEVDKLNSEVNRFLAIHGTRGGDGWIVSIEKTGKDFEPNGHSQLKHLWTFYFKGRTKPNGIYSLTQGGVIAVYSSVNDGTAHQNHFGCAGRVISGEVQISWLNDRSADFSFSATLDKAQLIRARVGCEAWPVAEHVRITVRP